MTEREIAALIEEARASEHDYGSNGRIRVLEDALRKQAAALAAAVTQRDAAERQAAELVKLESAYRESEQVMLRRLSDILTEGAAGQWEQITHAAEALRAERDSLTAALADATRAREALIAALRQKIDDGERDGLCEPARVRGLEEAIEVVRAQAHSA